MPIHDLKEVLDLIREGAWDTGTQDCRSNIRELGLTQHQVAEMVLLLRPNDFAGERPGMATEFGLVDADQYLLWYDDESKRRRRKGYGQPYFVKLGIDTDDEGSACVLISFHVATY